MFIYLKVYIHYLLNMYYDKCFLVINIFCWLFDMKYDSNTYFLLVNMIQMQINGEKLQINGVIVRRLDIKFPLHIIFDILTKNVF